MSLTDRGAAALVRRMKLSAGRPVTYTRGPAAATLTAWVGNTLFARRLDESGAAAAWGERDYLIAVADLQAANLFPPQRGDRLAEAVNGEPVIFELVAPFNDEPPWRYSDQTRQVVRLHTKRVA